MAWSFAVGRKREQEEEEEEEAVSRKQKASCFLKHSDSNKNRHTFTALVPSCDVAL